VWDELRDESDADEQAVAAHQRILQAEQAVYGLWERAGLGLDDWDAMTETGPAVNDEMLWMADLGRKLARLGGRLELAAIVGEEAIPLVAEPGPPNAGSEVEPTSDAAEGTSGSDSG
jgi:hypothetical protein